MYNNSVSSNKLLIAHHISFCICLAEYVVSLSAADNIEAIQQAIVEHVANSQQQGANQNQVNVTYRVVYITYI